MLPQVACTQLEVFVLAGIDDERALGHLKRTKNANQLPGLDFLELEAVHHEQAAFLELEGKGAPHRTTTHLSRGAVAVVARLGTVHRATADVRRSSNRAVAGSAGALLLVELLARTAHLGPNTGVGRAAAT